MSCIAESRPSDMVVLPSFCRVAAMKTRGVSRLIGMIAWQSLAGFRKQVGVRDRLYPHNGRYAQNIVRIGATGDVSRRTVESKQNLAVGIRPRDMLDQFACDVTRIQIGENEHRRAAG